MNFNVLRDSCSESYFRRTVEENERERRAQRIEVDDEVDDKLDESSKVRKALTNLCVFSYSIIYSNYLF